MSLGPKGDNAAVRGLTLSLSTPALRSAIEQDSPSLEEVLRNSTTEALRELEREETCLADPKRVKATLEQTLRRTFVAIRHGQEPLEALTASLRFADHFGAATHEPFDPD